MKTFPEYDDDTPVFRIRHPDGRTKDITIESIRDLLRFLCKTFGKKKGYRIEPKEIGAKSIRSGAAMALTLMNHSKTKIMILGRWSSDAFMNYIRPQVLEWTNLMAKDMARAGSFHDVNTDNYYPQHEDKSVASTLGKIPRFYLRH